MTVELFRADPYRSEFVARVTARRGAWVALDRTCFWPGDDHDEGRLDAHEVLDVRRRSDGILEHLLGLGDDGPPEPGDEVAGVIDWPNRYHAMRTHTAEHLVDLALRATHDVSGVSPSRSREGERELLIMLASGQLDCSTALRWVNDVISDDLPMVSGHDVDGSTRQVWHLDGHGHRPCDRLHVSSTGEIGTVHLLNAGRRGVRLRLRLEVGAVAEFTEGSS